MKKIVIGNDFRVSWTLNQLGQAFDLFGKTFDIVVKSPYAVIRVDDIQAVGNVVSFNVPASEQIYIGSYDIEINIEDDANGKRWTLRQCNAFALAPCCECSDVVEVVQLESNIVYPANGLSAYELAVLSGEYEGSYEGYQRWLARYAEEIASDANSTANIALNNSTVALDRSADALSNSNEANALSNEAISNSNKSVNLSRMMSIPIDVVGYVKVDGTLAHGTAWRYVEVAVTPNTRVRYRGIGQFNATLLLAFYDIEKKFIGGVPVESEDLTWEEVDVLTPDNCYYLRACTTIMPEYYTPGQEYLYILPEVGGNSLVELLKGADNAINSYNIRLFDTAPDKGSVRKQGNDFIINSFNNSVVSTYSSILLFKFGGVQFSNIRANNVVLSNGQFLVLSKSPDNLDRYNSPEELPYGTPNSNVYLYPISYVSINLAWDVVAMNYGGVLYSLSNTNLAVYNDVSDNVLKYGSSLKKPYNFRDKSALFFGDSVTYGVSTNPWTNPFENCWRKLFCEYAGLSGVNNAVSGSFIFNPAYNGVEPEPLSILSQVVNKVVDDSIPFIFIAGGINDFWTGKPVGSIEDAGNISFYGALNLICAHIKRVAPSSNVIFLTPINYSKIGGDTPVAGLNVYRNAIFEVAVMNGFSVVDTSIIGFPNEQISTPYRTALIEDGVHPTALGHKMMAENIYSILGE